MENSAVRDVECPKVDPEAPAGEAERLKVRRVAYDAASRVLLPAPTVLVGNDDETGDPASSQTLQLFTLPKSLMRKSLQMRAVVATGSATRVTHHVPNDGRLLDFVERLPSFAY